MYSYHDARAYDIVAATKSLLDKCWDAGEKGVESPVGAEVDYRDPPNWRRCEYTEPRSALVSLWWYHMIIT